MGRVRNVAGSLPPDEQATMGRIVWRYAVVPPAARRRLSRAMR